MKSSVILSLIVSFLSANGFAAEARGKISTSPHVENLMVSRIVVDGEKKITTVGLNSACVIPGYGDVSNVAGGYSGSNCNGNCNSNCGCCNPAEDTYTIELAPGDAADAQVFQTLLNTQSRGGLVNINIGSTGNLVSVESNSNNGIYYCYYRAVLEMVDGKLITKMVRECTFSGQGVCAEKIKPAKH